MKSVAVVGASGAVGERMIQLVAERNFPLKSIKFLASERSAGKTGPLVLVGHSQGANNVIAMAQELQTRKIQVDLLITLAPYVQDPVPANVVKAINFYQAGGWGAPLVAGPNFHGKISNVDMADEPTASHINIDKSPRVQAMILREVTGLSRTHTAAPAR